MRRHSVSLIPYVLNKGFIVCEEFRTNANDRDTKSVQSHFIGGKIEDGEDVIVAACREFYEEVGSGFTTPELIEAVTESVHGSCEIVVSEKKSLLHVFVIANTATMTGPVRDKFETVVESFEPTGDVHKLKYWNGFDKLDNLTSLVARYMDECRPTNDVLERLGIPLTLVEPEIP